MTVTQTIDPSALLANLGAKPEGAGASQANPNDTQRFEAIMDAAPPGTKGMDYYVEAPAVQGHPLGIDSVLQQINAVSHDMTAQLSKPPLELPDDAPPEVKMMSAVAAEINDTVLATTKFSFIAKAVENTERGIQTLYKLQG